MGIHLFWLLSPGLPGVLEVPDQLLLLGIDMNDGPVGRLKPLFLGCNVLKLPLSRRREPYSPPAF